MKLLMNSSLNIKRLILLTFLAFHYSCSKQDSFESNELTAVVFDNLSDDFPTMKINTNGRQILDEPKTMADLTVLENDNQSNYKIGIEIRGSSSQSFPKKSYGFESKNSSYTEDIDVSIGGFPSEEDWILYGPYTDKSLIRNKLVFDLSNSIGFKASNTKFYKLFINDENKGLYLLMEKIKRDVNRVNISKFDENSDVGGFIVKIDKPTSEGATCNTCYSESFSFRSNYNTEGNITEESEIYFIYHYPKPSDINNNQKQYIISSINTFESVLAKDNFDYSESPDYLNFINIDSFIDFFIINELTKNIDGYRLSTYLNKDPDGKLKMGPIWDFNLAFGNANYCEGSKATGWGYKFNSVCPGDIWQIPFWWDRLMESEYFKDRLKNRWEELRQNKLSNLAINNIIDSHVKVLSNSDIINENFIYWPILGKWVWPNSFIGNSHDEEITYMKEWIERRLSWMDQHMGFL
tara:strand:+ start:6174 stop:7568 length:1395 start_codon:yes stop_codon:yes gene_type:complete